MEERMKAQRGKVSCPWPPSKLWSDSDLELAELELSSSSWIPPLSSVCSYPRLDPSRGPQGLIFNTLPWFLVPLFHPKYKISNKIYYVLKNFCASLFYGTLFNVASEVFVCLFTYVFILWLRLQHCGSFWVRDRTCTTAVTQAAARQH